MKRPFTLIAAIIFAVVAIAHAYRLFVHFEVRAGSHSVPLWISVVAIAVTGVLAVGLYRESRR
jgi:uncharacterized integral membrane protein